jgi:hypothetical protein
MKTSYSILLLILSAVFFSCTYTDIKNDSKEEQFSKDYFVPEYVAVSKTVDSLLVSPFTKCFYSYKFQELDEWIIDPDWKLSTLYNHGIKVIEAWYHPGGGKANPDGQSITQTRYRPSFIVGLAEYNTDIWRYHFKPIANFDPIVASRGRMRHFIFKGIKKVTPNPPLKLTK